MIKIDLMKYPHSFNTVYFQVKPLANINKPVVLRMFLNNYEMSRDSISDSIQGVFHFRTVELIEPSYVPSFCCTDELVIRECVGTGGWCTEYYGDIYVLEEGDNESEKLLILKTMAELAG